MDLQVKRKRVVILSAAFIIIVLFCGITAFVLRDKKEDQRKLMEGIIIERADDYLSIRDETGIVYDISLEADYEGVPLSTLVEGDWIKIWYRGEIAESSPMQIVTFRIEK